MLIFFYLSGPLYIAIVEVQAGLFAGLIFYFGIKSQKNVLRSPLWGLEQLNTNACNPTTWFPYIVGIRIMMSSQNASIYFSVSITHCNVISLCVGWPRPRLRMTKWPMFVSDDSFGYPSGYDWNDPVCLLSTYVGLCRWQPTYIFT